MGLIRESIVLQVLGLLQLHYMKFFKIEILNTISVHAQISITLLQFLFLRMLGMTIFVTLAVNMIMSSGFTPMIHSGTVRAVDL